jgi:hypothetical protein
MSDYSERIESIASKLRDLLEESEQLKQLVEKRMMLEEDTDAPNDDDVQEDNDSEDSEGSESSEEKIKEPPVIPELVTRKPWCFFCCRRY